MILLRRQYSLLHISPDVCCVMSLVISRLDQFVVEDDVHAAGGGGVTGLTHLLCRRVGPEETIIDLIRPADSLETRREQMVRQGKIPRSIKKKNDLSK